MLNAFLGNAGRKMSLVARIGLILTYVTAAVGLIAGVVMAIRTEAALVALIAALGAAGVLLAGWLAALMTQGLAVAADRGCDMPGGWLANAPGKIRVLAKIMMILTFVGAGLVLVLGGLPMLMAKSWLGAALCLLAAGGTFAMGWLEAIALQALASAGGAMGGDGVFLSNAGRRVQLLASIVFFVMLAVCVVSAVLVVVQAVAVESVWVGLLGIVGAVIALLPGWISALMVQALGDAAEGSGDVRLGILQPLLGNSRKKVRTVASVYMVLTLVLAAVAVVAGLVVLVSVNWVLGLCLLAGALAALLLGWLAALQVRCLSDAAPDEVHRQTCWTCSCGTSNPTAAAVCSACGESAPVCPGCKKLLLLKGAEGCPRCRTRVRWTCSCGTANLVGRSVCRTCGQTKNR